ncbi:MFS transporter [Peribacillus cavernae]|uniref:MFS transporter n=1 Tax=Peribacillus cavernae TaxID=1674310 RepID=A0A433HJM1_9BACI|nr:MFS transporter [Peribacillus cavernae]MDQ0218299.1 YQGE family putative transporter [Peribacillus cavernae]RUQ28419.1 MFS transporter [Peribacillus cavernae]
MGILKKWIGEVEVKKDLHLLLLIGGLYSLSIALSNTFVNVYLWKQSGEFLDIGIYNLSIVLFQPLTFILAGRLAKKVDRIIVLRLGVIFLSAFYLCVLLVGTRATDFIVLLGGLLGVGYGFYWLAFNVLTFEITEPETRDFFNGFLGILSSFGGMIGPVLAGFIISRLTKYSGYSIVFGISLFLFFIAVILSFSLNRRPASGKYSFMRIWKERGNNHNWRMITYANFFQGLREGTFMFVVSIFVFIKTGSEMAIGNFGLINSAISFVAYYLASRYIKQPMRKKAILIGGVLLYIGVFLIAVDISYGKLLIYAGTIAIAYPLLLVPYVSMTYDIIGTAWNAAEMRIEYIVVREVFTHFGRIVSILGFIAAVTLFDPEESLPLFLLIIGAGHLCISLFVRKINTAHRAV